MIVKELLAVFNYDWMEKISSYLFKEEEVSPVYLYPSTLFVSKEPCIINTILGSCVSVCIWNKNKKYGGMNHFMLPVNKGNDSHSAKYGNVAIEQLISKMESIGANQNDLIAKVFGGSDTFNHKSGIGSNNIEIALEILKDMKIPVVSSSTGGRRGRKLSFNTLTGEVLMKYI